MGVLRVAPEGRRRNADMPLENAAEVGRILKSEFVCHMRDGRGDVDELAPGLEHQAILHQIEWARRDGRRHLYLGYWIDGHRKMDYKRRYAALEAFDGREWRPMAEPA